MSADSNAAPRHRRLEWYRRSPRLWACRFQNSCASSTSRCPAKPAELKLHQSGSSWLFNTKLASSPDEEGACSYQVSSKSPATELTLTSHLNKHMAELGLCARREADEWIGRGWVKANAQVVPTGPQVTADARIKVEPEVRMQ